MIGPLHLHYPLPYIDKQLRQTDVSHSWLRVPQVRSVQSSGLLLLGWATRGKGRGGLLPADLIQRCLLLVENAKKGYPMDVAIVSHAFWAKHNLSFVEGGANINELAAENDSSSPEETH